MKLLIFKSEQFSEGGYSKALTSTVDVLHSHNVIMSCEASNEVYKAIYTAGVNSALTSIEKKDESYITKGWKLIQEGL